MSIIDIIFSYLPAKRKQTPSGWIKFDAPCCIHNGETRDERQRGGMIKNADGISYHCFNCGYKASYQNGWQLNRKMRQLLSWLGAPDDTITKLALEALKIHEDERELEKVSLPNLVDKELPKDSIQLTEDTVNEDTALAYEYIYSRGFTIDTYPFYWSPELKDRVIIPFLYEGRTVGYTARKLTDGKPKYLSDQTPGYVFNLDAQHNDRKFVIVCEGPADALSIDGVAILGADIMDKQAMLINRLGKDVILLPDRDKDGKRTAQQALDLGWSVSMPDWDVKDANEALVKYGRLYTLYAIVNGTEHTSLKIQLKMKKWFNDEG